LDYIQHALKGSNDKIKALQYYLQSNSTIDALCYVPLNMTILLSLFEDTSSNTTSDDIMYTLPNTQTEMYLKFIQMTIVRFLKKCGILLPSAMVNIFELLEPYNKVLTELSQLAFAALKEDTIVFNIHDIAPSCPNYGF